MCGQNDYYGLMKLASVSQTKNQLSALLEQVRQGEVLVITDHDRPVAKITAISHESAPLNGQSVIAQLERKGVVRRGSGGHCELEPPVMPRQGASAVARLLDERASER
jgi:prevent-host-death family protein